MTTALILGSTGLVGGHCLSRLLATSHYERVVAIVRRPLPTHPKLTQLVTDFEKLDKLEPCPITDVYCALGTTIKKAGSQEAFRKVDYDYPLQLAEWAIRMGAKQFLLVSSVGADPKSASFYLRVKGELESAVSKLPYEAVHIFRPGVLLGERPETRPMERFAIKVLTACQFALVGGLRKYRP